MLHLGPAALVEAGIAEGLADEMAYRGSSERRRHGATQWLGLEGEG
jgi:hypothetical protein